MNPYLNAVIEDRFVEALKDARRADNMIEIVVPEQRAPLFSRYPLLGLPFTVKESCALKGECSQSFRHGNFSVAFYIFVFASMVVTCGWLATFEWKIVNSRCCGTVFVLLMRNLWE